LARAALKSFSTGRPNERNLAALARLGLDRPSTLKEHLLRVLMLYALSNVTD
jgi:hypothetical protein